MNIKRFKKDVRGAALVYVIVAAAIILLLGAATTATAYANLRATQIQEKSDNNFYSADTVMNAIVGGLESDISIAYERAYIQVITQINTYVSDEAANEDFRIRYLNELNSILNDEAESFAFYYSTSHIMGYVEDIFSDDVRYTVTALNGNNYLDVTDEGIVLRNLHVTYEDDNGYFDEISTDIKIAVPQVDLSLPLPETALDSIVIDDGLEMETGTGLIITGNTYINERESDSIYLADNEEKNNAILLQLGSSLEIRTPMELIAGGLIKTNSNTNLILQGTDETLKDENSIWTENFDFGRVTNAFISGKIYVYDDLGINGSLCDVKLSGRYYGYSKSNTNADHSSAINVNGAQTQLDIEELDRLVLGGSSYISTSTVTSDSYENDSDIQTGESLSVKSNQIAYLVDDTEFSDTDVPGFVSNPMSYQQYEDMLVDNGGWANVVSKIVNADVPSCSRIARAKRNKCSLPAMPVASTTVSAVMLCERDKHWSSSESASRKPPSAKRAISIAASSARVKFSCFAT
jgi:hypothetical protein